MLPAIDLGFADIYLYGPIFMLGTVIAVFIIRKLAVPCGVDIHDSLYAVIYGLIGLLIGAKALYFITKLPYSISHFGKYLDYLEADPMAALNYAFGGLVFYGGLIGFALGVLRYCRHFKIPLFGIVDLYTPFLPFVHGFGRIGCFMAGCCYGIEYHGVLAVHFPFNEIEPELSAVPRFPVQLLEAALNFTCFAVLMILMRRDMKRKESERRFKQGQLLGIYLTYYLVARFLLELLRGDDTDRGMIGFLSTSQIISLLLIVPAVLLLRAKGREKIFFVPQNEEVAGREPLCAENK